MTRPHLYGARLFAALLLLTTPAQAATLAGVSLPDTYPVAGQTLVLNGIGLRSLTIFNVHVYVAGLYLARQSHNPAEILASPGAKVILLSFVHSASKAQVEKQFRTGEENNCRSGACDPADAPDFERLIAAAPAVEPGDTSTYVFTPGHVRVLANSRTIADIANKDLALRILAGFIGDHPPSSELRAQLLGLGGN